MTASSRRTRILARTGAVLEGLGLLLLAAWAGFAAGWMALSVKHPSGGWCTVLILTSGVWLIPAGLVLFVPGWLLRRRNPEVVPEVACKVFRAVAVIGLIAAALFSFFAGWPR